MKSLGNKKLSDSTLSRRAMDTAIDPDNTIPLKINETFQRDGSEMRVENMILSDAPIAQDRAEKEEQGILSTIKRFFRKDT
jgi:hypothetical protein